MSETSGSGSVSRRSFLTTTGMLAATPVVDRTGVFFSRGGPGEGVAHLRPLFAARPYFYPLRFAI